MIRNNTDLMTASGAIIFPLKSVGVTGVTASLTSFNLISSSTSFVDVSSIVNSTTANRNFELSQQFSSGISHFVLEQAPQTNIRGLQIQREVQEKMDKRTKLGKAFYKILEEVDSLLVKEEKSYVILVNKVYDESDNHRIEITLHVENSNMGRVIELWNKVQRLIYENAEKISDERIRDYIKLNLLARVVDIKNGWQI